jgi:hypothetical protein
VTAYERYGDHNNLIRIKAGHDDDDFYAVSRLIAKTAMEALESATMDLNAKACLCVLSDTGKKTFPVVGGWLQRKELRLFPVAVVDEEQDRFSLMVNDVALPPENRVLMTDEDDTVITLDPSLSSLAIFINGNAIMF